MIRQGRSLAAQLFSALNSSKIFNFRDIWAVLVFRKKGRAVEGIAMSEVRKRLLIVCSCLLLGSVEVLMQVLGVTATR